MAKSKQGGRQAKTKKSKGHKKKKVTSFFGFMSFFPVFGSGSIDSTADLSLSGWGMPFVDGMAVTVNIADPLTGRSVAPKSVRLTPIFDAVVTDVIVAFGFTVLIPAGTLSTDQDYVLIATSSAGHPDASIGLHTSP